MPVTHPAVRDDLTLVECDDGEALVFDPQTGGVHLLNAEAALVFSLCDGSASVQQTAAEIAEEFGLPGRAVEQQVRLVVRDLRRNRLLATTRRRRTEDHDARRLVRIQVPRST
jgi:PqqD family protein of HPr-rel-A system